MEHTKRQPAHPGWRFVLLAVFLAVLISALVRAFLVDVYYIPSASMEPLLHTGDRVLVLRTDYLTSPVRRGDVVVFDGRGSFAPLHSGKGALADGVQTLGEWLGLAGSDTVYVKRVLGVAGDHLRCCSADGRITVNGTPVTEPYLYPGDAPSELKFDVVVPQGRLWMMGDHRSVSADSRSLLGAPGGGLVSEDKVIGRAVQLIWPLDRAAPVPRVSVPADQQKDTH